MKNLEIENQGNTSYLVYKIDDNNEIDSMTLGMITNNKIRGLAATSFTQIDCSQYIRYNISSKISVKQLFDGTVNKARFVGILLEIVEALLAVDEYMIDRSSLIMDLNYIYADVSSYDVAMICLPVTESGTGIDLGQFFKNIVITTIYDQTEPFDYIAKILNFLNGSPNFSTTDFRNLLEQLQHENYVQKKNQPQPAVHQAGHIAPVQSTVNVSTANAPEVQQIQAHHVQPPAPKPANVPVQNNAGWSGNLPQNAVPQNTATPKPAVPHLNYPNANNITPKPTGDGGQPSGEKEITLLGLLRNYSKENAAKYKEQKQNGKKAPPVKQVKNPVMQPKMNMPKGSFAVPGAAQAGDKGSYAPIHPVQQAVPNQKPQPAIINEKVDVPQQNAVGGQSAKLTTAKADFGNTTVLSSEMKHGETTVLQAPAPQGPHLVRLKNGEKIMLNKPVFRIGKERSYVDYFVSDNTAVSRSHANIITRDGKCFIMDTNSTNHTFVNGGMIRSNEEVALENCAKIRLANEEFEFRVF